MDTNASPAGSGAGWGARGGQLPMTNQGLPPRERLPGQAHMRTSVHKTREY